MCAGIPMVEDFSHICRLVFLRLVAHTLSISHLYRGFGLQNALIHNFLSTWHQLAHDSPTSSIQDTPMVCYQDSLLFGTAGNGGHFYVLSIKTGEKIADIKTGGTVAFVRRNNLCYFLVNDPNAKLICLDVLTGQVIDEVPLGGKNTYGGLCEGIFE